jgi:hypothetical protein
MSRTTRWATFATITVVLIAAGCGRSDDPVIDTPSTSTAAPSEPASAAPGGGESPAAPEAAELADGEWGTFTYGDVAYEAVARSCVTRFEGEPDTIQSFELYEGRTKNTLFALLSTQTGEEYGIELRHGSLDGEHVGSGSVTVSGGDMDHTFGRGTLDNGDPFEFSLILAGAPDC